MQPAAATSDEATDARTVTPATLAAAIEAQREKTAFINCAAVRDAAPLSAGDGDSILRSIKCKACETNDVITNEAYVFECSRDGWINRCAPSYSEAGDRGGG